MPRRRSPNARPRFDDLPKIRFFFLLATILTQKEKQRFPFLFFSRGQPVGLFFRRPPARCTLGYFTFSLSLSHLYTVFLSPSVRFSYASLSLGYGHLARYIKMRLSAAIS